MLILACCVRLHLRPRPPDLRHDAAGEGARLPRHLRRLGPEPRGGDGGGARGVGRRLLCWRSSGRRRAGAEIRPPDQDRIDAPLVAGSALFGIGWGLVGLCPGPALENLATLSPQVIVFCIAMAAGMVAHDQWYAKRPARAAPEQRACWPADGWLIEPRDRHHLPAVDDDRRAGDEAAGVGREQQQRAVEIARLAETAGRNLALDRRARARSRDSRG